MMINEIYNLGITVNKLETEIVNRTLKTLNNTCHFDIPDLIEQITGTWNDRLIVTQKHLRMLVFSYFHECP